MQKVRHCPLTAFLILFQDLFTPFHPGESPPPLPGVWLLALWFFSSFPHGTFSYQALKYISSLKVVPPILSQFLFFTVLSL